MSAAVQTKPAQDFVVGQKCTYHQLVDDKLVRAYADLTGDHNKIHVDDAFAKKTKFGQRIAHGGIMFGMISKVLGGEMPGNLRVQLGQGPVFGRGIRLLPLRGCHDASPFAPLPNL